MTDDEIQQMKLAQLRAREAAALNGQNIHRASIHAGEQAVLESLRKRGLLDSQMTPASN